MDREQESFRAILKAYSQRLFLCSFLWSIPFLRQIKAVNCFFITEKLFKSAYLSFYSQASSAVCSFKSLNRTINSFYRFTPQSILNSALFYAVLLRMVFTLALHLGKQKFYVCYSCSLRFPSNDYSSFCFSGDYYSST